MDDRRKAQSVICPEQKHQDHIVGNVTLVLLEGYCVIRDYGSTRLSKAGERIKRRSDSAVQPRLQSKAFIS
jgi:hypothetical protein